MATCLGCSSSVEQREGEGSGVETEKDPNHREMINKLANALMKKLTSSDPSKTLTPDHMNGVKQCLSGFYPVFRSPDHPTYAAMIQRAIAELNKEGGSTQEAISKFIRERFDCLPLAHESFLSHHLKKLSDSGEILSASNNCYMLPAEENGYVSRSERVQKKKCGGLGRGRRTRNGIEHKKLAEEQVEVTEHREQRQQSQEPEVIVDQNGCSEQHNEQQDEVNGEVAMVVAKQKYKAIEEQVEVTEHREQRQQSQEPEVIVDQNGYSEQKNEQHDEVSREVAMVAVKTKYKVTEEQVEVTEQQIEQGKQSQELSLQEQHSKVIDDHSVSPEVQLDEANGQKTEKQMQEVAVIVKKQHNSEEKYKATEEPVEVIEQIQHGQNCLEPNQEQDELTGQQSQMEMQEVVLIVEKQLNAKEKYKVTEEQVEVTEQRLHWQQSQKLSLHEQQSKLIDSKRGSPDKQYDEVNGQQRKNQMEEGAVIVEKQNNSEQKFKSVEEQVEVTEKRRERRQQSQKLSLEEPYNMVIDIRIGSPEKQNEYAYEANGQQMQKQMHENAVTFQKQSTAEHKYKVTEQQGERGQKNQEEHHSKVIDYPNESPEKQNEHEDEANEQQIKKQMQENAVNFQKHSDAEQKYKVTEENIQAQRDELIEERCQSEEQQCEVTGQQLQIEGIDREIQLLEEQVEIIEKLTKPGQQIEMISERNKPQEQSELISKIVGSRNMQELLSKKQEKYAATAINSSPSLTSQKLPHHGSSLLSEEKYVELLMRTRKLEEKLLENLSSIREGSNHSTQKASKDLEVLFSKHRKLDAHGSQPQMPKCQNKSISTFRDVELPQQEEIGNLERSLELVTMEAENIREVSRHVGKKTCLNFEAKHEKEKHSAACDPNLCCQPKPSVSLQPELQKPRRPQDVELLSVEGGHRAHESEPDIMNSSVNLCQASHHQKRQLCPQHKKTSESGYGVPKARKCQLEHELQPENPVGIPKQLETDCQLQHGQLTPYGQRLSASDCCEVMASKLQQLELEQLPENQVEERPIEVHTETLHQSCQTQHWTLGQQQRRQLRSRGRKSDCGNQKDGEEQQAGKNTKQSCQRRHQAPDQQKLRGLGTQDQRASSYDPRVGNAPGCQELENEMQPREEIQDMGMKLDHFAVKLSFQAQKNTQEPAQQRQLRLQPQRHSKSDESVTKLMVESPPTRHQDSLISNLKEAQKPQELKASAAKTGPTQQHRQLRPQGKKLIGSREVLSPSQSLDEQYPLLSNSGRSRMQQPGVDYSSQLKNRHRHDELSQTIKELQWQCHMKLRSHSQGVSQSDPSVSMTESSPSQNRCEEPQEKMHHDELQHLKHQKHKKPPRANQSVDPTMEVLSPSADQRPQKRGRGRPPKAKLATVATSDASLSAKCQKQKEQPENRKQGRPRKLTEKITLARIKLTLKNQPRQQK